MNVERPSAMRIEHKSAAAEVARVGKRDSKRKADRDRGVDGVAAISQNGQAHLGRMLLTGNDHRLPRAHRITGGGREAGYKDE